MPDESPIENALLAYAAGHEDGAVRRPDPQRAGDAETGPDYRVGVADGSLIAFQAELVDQVRRLLGDPTRDSR
jgi:hypothetical protein